jgi:predicted AlkP superfamily pyrophosphatase or phosphodiesterase
MKTKKILKITAGVIIFITLPSLLLFGYLYFKYNDDIPYGTEGEKAEVLAVKMLDALNFEAFEKTNYIEWTFKNKHHYQWEKDKKICTVYWKDYKVVLNLNDTKKSKAYIHSFTAKDDVEKELIEKAIEYFNNDSFWLVAPYKIFDEGTERRLVTLENGDDALLVTYTSGGTTPGDSYLWEFNAQGKPKSFKMWVSLLPLKGVEASWSDWIITESGAQLPTFHRLLFFGLEMGDVKGSE